MAICAHCQSTIVSPASQVVHGEMTYCCANCAAAMEEHGSGSDPKTLSHPDAMTCAHCGCRIVDESTLVERGDSAFCCGNCAAGMAEASR